MSFVSPYHHSYEKQKMTTICGHHCFHLLFQLFSNTKTTTHNPLSSCLRFFIVIILVKNRRRCQSHKSLSISPLVLTLLKDKNDGTQHCLHVFFFLPILVPMKDRQQLDCGHLLPTTSINAPIKGRETHFYVFSPLKNVKNSIYSLYICPLCVVVPLLMLAHLRNLFLFC